MERIAQLTSLKFSLKILTFVIQENLAFRKTKVTTLSLSSVQIIVLEDTKEYISYAPKEATAAQDRRPFDLLVC